MGFANHHGIDEFFDTGGERLDVHRIIITLLDHEVFIFIVFAIRISRLEEDGLYCKSTFFII